MNFNKLTERLIAEGYTAEHHPDYVKVAGKGLNNFYGGFEYIRAYRDEMTFETPCGMLCKGVSAMGGAVIGKEWDFENDNPLIHCPYHRKECEMRHKLLRGHGYYCGVHPTSREYDLKGSVEEASKEEESRIYGEKQEFIKSRNGRVCPTHMRYNYEEQKWEFNYFPEMCISNYCQAEYCRVLGKALDAKGNVYYDVRFEGRDYSKDGTFFEGERFERIIKGVPLFKKPIKLAIAEVIAKTRREYIEFLFRYNSRYYDQMTLYKAEKGEIDLKWTIENIRAEKRLVRDLDADLSDIDNGIEVTHEIDLQKQKQKEKLEKRQKAKEKSIERLENKILKNGFEELDTKTKQEIRKKLDPERVRDLNREFKRKPKYEQMSLEKYLEGDNGKD